MSLCDECGRTDAHASWCSSLPDAEVETSEAMVVTGTLTRLPYSDRPATPYCLGFHRLSPGSTDWVASPAIPYRVKGLLVWGADETTQITRLQVANICALQASADPIPALLFSAGYSFAEFLNLLVDGQCSIQMGSRLLIIPPHFPFQEVIERTLSPAVNIHISFTGPLTTLVTWGWAIEEP